MTRKWFTILFLLSLSGYIVFSQDATRQERSPDSDELAEKQRLIIDQAITVLRENLVKAKSIDNLRQRAVVISEASFSLWDNDRVFAEESIVTFINQLLADYKDLAAKEKRTADENTALRNIDYALKKGLRTLARKDVNSANLLQNKYFEIREKGLNGKNLNESLDLAAEGLDLDEQRTLALFSAIIQQGIPSQFTKLISDLRAKNPAIADILMRRAIENLAVHPNYKAADAIYISVVIFNEEQSLIPWLNDAANPNNFGIITQNSTTSDVPSAQEDISAYYTSVQSFFNSRLMNQTNDFFRSPQNLIQSYFLIEKLRAYGQLYGLGSPEKLNNILAPVALSMHTAGFSQQTLSDVSGYAIRLSRQNNPLQLDDGTDLLEKAEKAKTPEEKLDFLVRGIIQLINFKQFAKAESKIFDIQNPDIRDALYTLLYQRAAVDAIERKDWNDFEKRTEKVSEKRIRAFLYLRAVTVLLAQNNDDILTMQYSVQAEQNSLEITDKSAKASAFVYLSSLIFLRDQTEINRILSITLKSINDAVDYDENPFQIRIDIPTRQIMFAESLGGNSFRGLFSGLANKDWTDSLVQVNGIKSNGLRAIAQVVAADAILNSIKSGKRNQQF